METCEREFGGLDILVNNAGIARTGGVHDTTEEGWDEVINEEPGEVDRQTVDNNHPVLAPFVYLLLRISQMMLHDLFHLKLEGINKLPATRPFIIAPNHQSYIDGPILVACLPWGVMRDGFYVGTSEIFGSRLMRWLASKFRLIVIDPDANLVPAMRASAYGLRKKRVLVLYPEGERSIDGQPKMFRKGAAILAIHEQCPIVPVALEGFYETWPRGEKFRGLANLQIRFLDPVYPPPLGPNPEQQYAAMTAEVRNRVLAAYDELRAHR